MLKTGIITLKFDREAREYYVIWESVVIATGTTRREALEDLRTAAHFGVDTMIDLKLRSSTTRKEN
jgi:hypothetical protein